MKHFVLGIDVGGTNIRFGLVNPSGKIVFRSSLLTKDVIKNKNRFINALIHNCINIISKNKLKRKSLIGIGVGLPGLINTHKGIIHFLPNIPGWKNVPLKKILQKKLRIPVFLENDANLIALGEWKFGAGCGVKNMICVTLGTGVGGGLILNNQLYRGEGFAAGELGHIPLNEKGVRCNCGGTGCLESVVGNQPLQKKARKLMKRNISLEEMDRLAAKGNRKALRFWEETAVHIGNGLVGVVNVLNPARIVMGGGVSNAYRHIFGVSRRIIKKRTMKVQGDMVEIVKAKLGNDAGILGAQVLVKHARLSR